MGKSFLTSLVETFHDHLIGDLKAILETLKSIEESVRDLKCNSNRGLRYRGVYKPLHLYVRDDAVTYRSGLWVCLGETNTKPPSSKWQLAVKASNRKDMKL